MRYDRRGFSRQRFLVEDELLQADRGLRIVRFVHDFLKTIMGHDVQAIDRCDTGPLAVRQTQTATNALFNQSTRIGRSQWHDRVEVGDVPAFLQHVDVDDNFDRIVGLFYSEQLFDGLLFLAARIDLDHLVSVARLEERVRLDELHQLRSVGRVACDDQDERLDDLLAVLASIGLQLHLDAFVQTNAILQLHLLDCRGRLPGGDEILPRDDRRVLYEAIFHRAGQWVVVDHITEWHWPAIAFDERRRSEF